VKVIPIALATDYAQGGTHIAAFLKVTRGDGLVLGFTSTDDAIPIAGVTYYPGFDLSNLQSTDTLGVDNMELQFLALDDLLPEDDLLTGLWNNAAFEVFEGSYTSIADGVNVLKGGTTGEVQLRGGQYIVEFRSLTQALQQTQVTLTSKTCPARFADYPSQFGLRRCGLAAADFTVTGTFTAVASAQLLTDSGRAEDDDWFAEGILKVTSGPAIGQTQKIKVYASGAFTLSLPLDVAPEVGDTYTAISGCRKRLEEDCVGKYGNGLNFQGHRHLPGADAVMKSPKAAPQPETITDADYEGGGGAP
jgi:uncharacterized phage protein (TIGR02218 family)